MPKRASVATRSCSTDGSTTPVDAHVVGQQPRQGALELLGPVGVLHLGDALDAVAEEADVAPHERGEDVDDRRLLDGVEPADRAEVDEAEAAVTEGEDVAGVRIGVEEPDAQHLVERRAEQLAGRARCGRCRRRRARRISATVKPSKRSCTSSRRVQ